MKNILSGIVLFCSGVNLRFLNENCPNERHKFYPIGLGVMVTASLGFLSMMFATHSIFETKDWKQETIIILFSLFWAFAIFTIDWGLVKTMKKSANARPSFGERVRYFIPVLFRLAVAVILSYSISRPMEMKIYEQRLAGQIHVDKLAFINREDSIKALANQRKYGQQIQTDKQDISKSIKDQTGGPTSQSYKSDVAASKRCETELPDLISKNKGLEAIQRKELSVIYNTRENHIKGVIDSPYNKEGIRKCSPHYKQIKELQKEVAKKVIDCNDIATRMRNAEALDSGKYHDLRIHLYPGLAANQKSLKQQEAQDSIDKIETRKQAEIAFNPKHPGLITELESMSNYEKTPAGKSAGIVRLILLLVIICIDTSPIVIKLLTKRGGYEQMQDEEDARLLYLSMYETFANKRLVHELSLAQKDVLTAAIKQWKDKEMAREDLSNAYINSNPDNKS